MKWNLLGLLFISFSATSQSFSISPSIADSLGPQSFVFEITGTADFNDSMIVSVQLLSADSVPQVLFSGTHDFSQPGNTTLTGFTYDSLTHVLTIPLGTYPDKNMLLIIRSLVGGTIREELVINRFEAIPDEE